MITRYKIIEAKDPITLSVKVVEECDAKRWALVGGAFFVDEYYDTTTKARNTGGQFFQTLAIEEE
jgi:hypothetical protein